MMQTHNLIQGSPEWLAYRAQHFNASDAPAMMGCSKYKTRAQLLRELATGQAQEADAGTRRLWADGHRAESKAQPLAEDIVGEELAPVVASRGKLSASFDGLTLMADTAFEHKALNDELRRAFDAIEALPVERRAREGGALLPLMYRVQMEQQCAVAECERVLFMATKWDGGTLLEQRFCWYYPDTTLRASILAGWEQFAAELATWAPEAAKVEPIARGRAALPALRIEVKGAVTVSNLPAFKAQALQALAAINTELTTDQHFADADADGKWLGDVESRIAAAKAHAQAQAEDIDALFRAMDEIAEEARAKRLQLEKLVKARKDEIRAEVMRSGVTALAAHVAALNARLGRDIMPVIAADFAGAVKGKRTIESLRNAVDTTLANAKIEASATADRIAGNLKALELQGDEWAALFPDVNTLALKPADDFAAIVGQRIAAERQRRTDAEAAKAQAAAPAAPAANVVPLATRGGGGRMVDVSTWHVVEEPATASAAAVDLDALLTECLELVSFAGAVFVPPSRAMPKPAAVWWNGLRERIEKLRPQLEQATAP